MEAQGAQGGSTRRLITTWAARIAAGAGLLLAFVGVVVVVRALTAAPRAAPVEPLDIDHEVDAQAAVTRLSEALALPTISPADPDDDVTPFVLLRRKLESDFPTFHERAQRTLVGGLTLHFVLEGSERDAGHVVFLAHQDVVPVEEGTHDDWVHPPFSGAVADGYVWGRGALDNKQNMMALLEAAEMWLAAGGRSEHTLHFVFGHDEEIGGLDGARAVADAMNEEELDVVAVYDEGLVIVDGLVPGIDGRVALVGITERGYLTVEISATAEGGHSSMPPDELAVVRLADALAALDANPLPAAIDGPTRMMFDWTAPKMGFSHRLIFRNLWLFERLVLSQMTKNPGTHAAVRTTAAPTMLRASDRENVLPQRAVATVNFRLNPRDRIEDVLDYLEDLIGDDAVSVRAVGDMRSEPSPLARLEGAGFDALRRALATTHPEVPLAPNMVTGATDSRHFADLTADIYRFSPMILGESDLPRLHGTNERIAVDDYLDLIDYYAALLSQW